MDTHKWMSRLAVLLAVTIVLVPSAGLTRAEGPVEAVVPNQPEGPAGLASPDAGPHNFLAIGVQYEDVSTNQDAGAVNVIYSSDVALTADGNQIWYEGYNGLPGAPEENDYLGKALAVGDFDGDGNLDLAIGIPYEDYNIIPDAGIVRILYGANGTLTGTGSQMWYQGFSSIVDDVEADDHFGSALAVGDFDGDGYQDLAIGVPGEQLGDDDNAGVVNVIYGSATGLTDAGNQLWSQGTGDIAGLVEAEDWFGYSLASADFDGDGYDDLAVGVPYEDQNGDAPGDPIVEDAGGVNIIYGSASGLTSADNWWASQNLGGIPETAAIDDLFGWALAVGDFDGDHYADLAVGVPYEDTIAVNTGIVHAIYGSATGLTLDGNQIWSQSRAGIADDPEENDRFGYSLTAGDFDGDGHDDLVVGVPYEEIDSAVSAGMVHVLYGESSGLTGTGSLTLYQGHPDINNTSEVGDRFGMALAAGSFDGDSYADLAVGAPGEDLSIFAATYIDAGAVHAFYGSATGLSLDGDQFWHQNSTDIEGVCEDDDEFGRSLAANYRVRVYRVYLPLIRND